MEDLQSINTLINDAVESSSYTTVLISSSVFILYTLIIKIVDIVKSKERNRSILDMATAIKEISENVVRLNNVLDKTFKEAEIKEADKVRHVVELACSRVRLHLVDECSNIIVHNNIHQNRDLILHNINKLASTEYYKLYSILSAYTINDINVATKLREEWIQSLTDECLEIIYNGQNTLDRVRQLSIRMQLSTEQIATYIINKVFNH